MEVRPFTRYISPVTEESLKALFIVFLLWRRRVGFLVDAAVLGFGVGAGFAVVENIDYLRAAPPRVADAMAGPRPGHRGPPRRNDRDLRDGLEDADGSLELVTCSRSLPGLALAIAIHSAFNHVLLPPLAMTS